MMAWEGIGDDGNGALGTAVLVPVGVFAGLGVPAVSHSVRSAHDGLVFRYLVDAGDSELALAWFCKRDNSVVETVLGGLQAACVPEMLASRTPAGGPL